MFVPWHAADASQIGDTPAAWNAYLRQLELEAESCEETDANTAMRSAIARGRLFRINQVAKALTTKSTKATIMKKWRTRNRALREADDNVEAVTAQNLNSNDKKTKAEEDIEEIRAEASRRADSATLQRAARREAWADENFDALSDLHSQSVDLPAVRH